MEDAAIVGKLQGARDLGKYFTCFFRCQRAFVQAVPQGSMFNVWHSEVMPGLLHTILERGQDMVVFKLIYRFSLAPKTLDRISMVSTDNLHRNLPVHSLIISQIDL